MSATLQFSAAFGEGGVLPDGVSIAGVTQLWESVEWDWYRHTADSDFFYWHWSPQWSWQIQHPLIGFNEVMIAYLRAIASPTHGVPAEMYYSGWAGQSERATEYRAGWSGSTDGGHYANGHAYYGIKVGVGFGTGAALSSHNTPILDSIRTASVKLGTGTRLPISRTTATLL